MTEEEIRGLFREMREDSVPADSLARVRMGVAGRTARRGWKFAAWAVAPLCLLVLALVALRSPAPPPPLPVRVAPAVFESRPAPVVRRRQVARRTRTTPPVLIRIETPDPEVVILLVGN